MRSALKVTVPEKDKLAEEYLLENMQHYFPGHTLLTKERLFTHYTPDFHLQDKQGNDLFIEIKSANINKNNLGQILDHYSAILNYDTKKKGNNPKLVIVGEDLDSALKKKLARLNFKFISLNTQDFYKKIQNEERERRLKILTQKEALIVLDWEIKGQKSITVDTIARKLNENRNYASKLLHRLEKKKWLAKISRGIYNFIPALNGYEERFPPMNPFQIGSELIQPYYFGYSTANSRYGFSKQLPSTYYVVTTKKKNPVEWSNIRFQFITLSSKKFFGFSESNILGVRVNISDPERTLIDAVEKMNYCGGIEEVVNIIQRGLKQVNESKLVDYISYINSYSLNQRFGFIIDFLDKYKLIPIRTLLRKYLLKNIGKSPIYLDARRPRHGNYIGRWNILQNVEDKELLSEITQ